MNKKISRRDFLKLAGTTSVGMALSACGVKATELPTATQTMLPTATSIPPTGTPLPTVTSTFTPTPVEQLSQTKQALAEFVQAFKMANVEISADQVSQKGFLIRTISGKDGTQYDVAMVNVDNVQLGGDYPLMIKMDGNWVMATPKNLGTIQNKLIGITVGGGDKTSLKPMYGERAAMFNIIMPPAAFSERYMGQNGNPETWLEMAKVNNQHFIVSTLFGKKVNEGVVANEEYAVNRARTIFKDLKDFGIKNFTIELSLEPFGNSGLERKNPYYKGMGENWIVKAYQIMWDVAKEFGLTVGKDFSVIGVTGVVPIKNIGLDSETEDFINQVMKIKQGIASKLNILIEEIPFDIGGEMFFGNGEPIATITPIPISILEDKEAYFKGVQDFISDMRVALGSNTELYINGLSIIAGADFARATELTNTVHAGILPYAKSIVYWSPLSIDHLGRDRVTYSDSIPNTFFGDSPDFNLGAPFFALNAALMNI